MSRFLVPKKPTSACKWFKASSHATPLSQPLLMMMSFGYLLSWPTFSLRLKMPRSELQEVTPVRAETQSLMSGNSLVLPTLSAGTSRLLPRLTWTVGLLASLDVLAYSAHRSFKTKPSFTSYNMRNGSEVSLSHRLTMIISWHVGSSTMAGRSRFNVHRKLSWPPRLNLIQHSSVNVSDGSEQPGGATLPLCFLIRLSGGELNHNYIVIFG